RGNTLETAAAFRHERTGAAWITVREMVVGDGDLDDALERLARVALGRLPDSLEHLVHLEEEPFPPEHGGPPDRDRDRRVRRRRQGVAVSRRGAQGAGGVR